MWDPMTIPRREYVGPYDNTLYGKYQNLGHNVGLALFSVNPATNPATHPHPPTPPDQESIFLSLKATNLVHIAKLSPKPQPHLNFSFIQESLFGKDRFFSTMHR